MMQNKTIIRCYCANDQSCLSDHDYCDTDTVCMTKLVVETTSSNTKHEFYKYYCGEFSKSSFRYEVLGFVDCKIKTTNKENYEMVKNSSEYCCNDYDMCNKDLKPFVASKINWLENPSSNLNSILSTHGSGSSIFNNELSTFNKVLIILLAFLFISMFILAVILLYIHKRNKNLNKNNKKTKITTTTATAKISKYDKKKRLSKRFKFLKPFYIINKKNSIKLGDETNDNENLLKNPIYKVSSVVVDKSLLIDTSKERPYVIGENITKLPPFNNNIIGHDFSHHLHHIQPSSVTVTTNINSGSSHTTTTTGTTTTRTGTAITATTTGSSNTCNSSNEDNHLTTEEFLHTFSGSGSGSGHPICVERTIARDIKLIENIGKGRYGSVWKGKWLGEEWVAVKTFNTNEEKSWENEIGIYLTQCLRHDNILGFIAADNIDRGMYTELWIITDYHENGALYDYLNANTITPQQLYMMCLSCVKGLVHLHMTVHGCHGGKVPLAHCDLKSKNILVKSDLTCCIGDLGLAICGDIDGNLPAHEIRTGTKRYMAPELLDRSIDKTRIASYQNADMYALSLVFWEILRRCKYNDETTNKMINFEFQVPYYQYVDMNPDEIQMRKVVCEQQLRPELLDAWKTSRIKIISEITKLIEELWDTNPNARLTALNVKKVFDRLKAETSYNSNSIVDVV